MGWRQSLFPPARETQPRGSGAERIIKAGKRGWERRGGAWGGGFTRPGSCYTGLGARASPCIPPPPPTRPQGVLGLSGPARLRAREQLQPCAPKVRVGVLAAPPWPLPPAWGPLQPGVSRAAAQNLCTPTHVAGLGLPLTSHPGGRCDAIDREALIGYKGLPRPGSLSIYRLSAQG